MAAQPIPSTLPVYKAGAAGFSSGKSLQAANRCLAAVGSALTRCVDALGPDRAEYFELDGKHFDFSRASFSKSMQAYFAELADNTIPPSNAPSQQARAEVYQIVRKQFDFSKAGFMQATEAYASAMAQVISLFMNNTQKTQQTQAKESDAFTKMAQTVSTQVAAQWQKYDEELAEANSNSMGWLGYLIGGLTMLIGILTEDPALVMMGMYQIVTTATHFDPIANACEGLTGSQLGGEALAGVFEGLAMGGIEALGEKLAQHFCADAAAKVAAEAGSAAGKAAEQTIAKQLLLKLKNLIANIGMALMMSTFWEDVAAKIPGVGQSGAIWLGLLFAISFSGIAGLMKDENMISKIVKKAVADKFGTNGLKALQALTVTFTMIRNGAQMGQGVETIKQGEELEKVADILRQVATTQGEFTLIQSLCDMFSQAMTQTQSTVNTVNQDYTAFNQTMPSLARMMDINHQQAV